MLPVTFYGNRHGASTAAAKGPTFSIRALAQATLRWLFMLERRIGALEFAPIEWLRLGEEGHDRQAREI